MPGPEKSGARPEKNVFLVPIRVHGGSWYDIIFGHGDGFSAAVRRFLGAWLGRGVPGQGGFPCVSLCISFVNGLAARAGAGTGGFRSFHSDSQTAVNLKPSTSLERMGRGIYIAYTGYRICSIYIVCSSIRSTIQYMQYVQDAVYAIYTVYAI